MLSDKFGPQKKRLLRQYSKFSQPRVKKRVRFSPIFSDKLVTFRAHLFLEVTSDSTQIFLTYLCNFLQFFHKFLSEICLKIFSYLFSLKYPRMSLKPPHQFLLNVKNFLQTLFIS